MQTTTKSALTLAALLTSSTLYAADLPGKGITVHPVQSPLPEETFQTDVYGSQLDAAAAGYVSRQRRR